jgi:hypothetical protein
MTAMVTGVLIPMLTRCVIHTTDKALMFNCFIDMAVKRPHRPATEGTDDEPYHDELFEHYSSIHNIHAAANQDSMSAQLRLNLHVLLQSPAQPIGLRLRGSSEP